MNRLENHSHMKQNIAKSWLIFILTILIVPMMAQTTPATETQPEEPEEGVGSSEIIVTNVVELTLNDANKILVNPKPTDTVYKAPEFDYTIRELKLETPFKVVPIKAAKMKGQPLEKLYSNYVAVGMGTRATPYGEIFHSKTRSRQLNYGLHGRHFSSAANIDGYAYPGYSDNLFEGYVTKFGKGNAFSSSAKYRREAVHYYGFMPDSVDQSLILTDDDANKQVFTMANAKFNWYRYRPKRKQMDFQLGGDYSFYADKYSNYQHTIDFGGNIDWHAPLIKALDRQRLGFSLNTQLHMHQFDTLASNFTSIINLAPYYNFEYEVFKASIGFKTTIFSNSIDDITFFPNIQLEAEGIKDILYFTLAVDGGVKRNNYMELSQENPFILPFTDEGFSLKKIGFNFGLESSISQKINFSVNFDYANWENAMLFVNDTTNQLMNKFAIETADYELMQLSTAISYQHHDHLLIMLDGQYNIYNIKKGTTAWHKPQFEVGLRAKYNMGDKILVSCDVITYGNTYARGFDDQGNVQEILIKPWVDANIGLEYRFSKKFGAFANVNNIAASKYQRWYNYPTYGFSVMGGVSYIF
jgi:hypothetical protein